MGARQARVDVNGRIRAHQHAIAVDPKGLRREWE